MKVFITGASGFVGRYIVRELLAQGHSVVALLRQGKSLPGVEVLTGDITSPEAIDPRKLEGCQAAIHLVGIIREFPRRNVTFSRLHVEGTRNILKVCESVGIKRYVHMSALGARVDSRAGYQRSKAEAEKLVRGSSLDWTIIRPGVILGPQGEFFKMIRTLVKLPLTPMIGNGQSLMAPVAIATVARAFVQALDSPEAHYKKYDLGGEVVTYQEMMEKLASAMGRKIRILHVPMGVIRKLAELFDRFSFFPITREQLIMLEETAEPQPPEIYRDLNVEFLWLDEVFNLSLHPSS
jgi:uncharacterized protein YbjT (DUF2867 family)